ncbi:MULTISPECIES: DNA repair protein RecO [Caproicibacterium]|jgi:DNA repair protein RecO (recombination protein O)|uniref:DNA repair protein RecO n=1 Tax=Caproicibacterium lactatifermentans TaxID=2666138 RepID=A0A859DUN8_9FIRM|nr:DNA repair protein RecO [Caproicibacterium lactatifermentans]ARP51155.1 DNA repair protein RecO [Ruminococcaceae bacterium CPB6]MDD4807815.1 DNA repair protein RecO [Oscillospiraceae bacterium]QKN24652.1 DNA repair protein RecO [Caproicibacterium lactatifermentans]QKO30151.1 DNA repair protein RecO [Caproicibacterium lactatifermentans]
MRVQTQGVVIRVSNVGERDRLVTVLTRDRGVVRAFARNSRAAKSSLVSATQLFCYARILLFCGKDKYIIDDAQPLEVFFELRQDIGRLSLAQYFCELAGELAPQEDSEKAADFLRLLLCAFRRLCRGGRPLPVVKAATEMRMLSLAGYMPDLIGCAQCRKYEDSIMYFYPLQGELLCPSCRQKNGRQDGIALHKGALTALRHTVYADLPKLFSFTLGEQGQQELARASEEYLLDRIEYHFRTLDFYHTVVQPPA